MTTVGCSNFDNNTWYQFVNNGIGPGSGLQSGYENPGLASIFGSPFTNTDNWYSWQIINSTDPGTYLIRSRSSGANLFVSSWVNETCGNPDLDCYYDTPAMTNSIGPQSQWFIEEWGDGTCYLYPKSNGSDWHLAMQENGSWLYLTTNVTEEDDSQSWFFNTIGSIDDSTFSTISSLSATTTAPASHTPTPKATQTSAPTSNANTSSGLSTGAQAAIGATIGGIALIAAIVLGLWYRRRRLRKTQSSKYEAAGKGDWSSPERAAELDVDELTPERKMELGMVDDNDNHKHLPRDPVEAPDTSIRYELADTSMPQEMEHTNDSR